MGLGEWLGIALFVVGIPVAWWLGRRNRQRPAVRYGIDERELIRADDSLIRGGLDVHFRDRRVERLCRSYLALWLRSGDPLAGAAIPATDPLAIELSEGDRVLSARVVAESRPQIGVAVEVDEGQRAVRIGFEFLDLRDGFVVEVLHEQHAPPVLRGSFPGATITLQPDVDLSPKGREILRRSWWKRFRTRYRAQAILVIAVGLIAMTALLTLSMLEALGVNWLDAVGIEPASPPKFNGWSVGLYAAVSVLLVLMLVDIAARARRRVPKAVVANDYEEAFDWTPAPAYEDGTGRSYRVGDMIEHPDFGVGVIRQITGASAKLVLHVAFEDAGSKKLLAQIAPIRFVTNVHGEDI
jgi:hypothetical protein